jgi:hypothetical protein
MGKFINVPLPLYSVTADMATPAIAGTSSGAATGKLTFATGGFNATVAVGYVVLNTATFTVSTVTAVDSDTVLSISGNGNATLEASGATFKIWSATAAFEFLVASGNFKTDVRVGDVVVNFTSGRTATVAKVNSDISLQLDRVIFDDNGSDAAVVISQNGFGGRLVNIENVLNSSPIVGGAGTAPVELTYRTKTAATDTLTINISEAQANYSWQMAFEELMIDTLESNWKHIVNEMPLIASPSGSGAPILYATSVTLA